MDMTCIVGTDIASFLLYEPEALRHRAASPWGWFSDFGRTGDDLGVLTVPERIDGRLVLIDTAIPVHLEEDDRLMWVGSDGAYRFRCTTGSLTVEESLREYPETHDRQQSQTIHVTHERLLLDGGYLIPFDHTPDAQEPYAGMPYPVIPLAEAIKKQLVAWLALPNGTYQVTAHYLAPSEEDSPEDVAATIALTFACVS